MKMASNEDPEMMDEYDFSHGIRGKYANRFGESMSGEATMVVDQETAMSHFLTLARSWHEKRLKAAELVREIVAFFRDVRISGADIDAGNDALVFQWGAGKNLLYSEPTDLRQLTDDQLKCDDDSESVFLEFTRQVFAPDAGKEAEFDDLAISMSVFLLYGPASGQEPDENLWITSLQHIDRYVEQFMSQPFVSELLRAEPTCYVSLVYHCG